MPTSSGAMTTFPVTFAPDFAEVSAAEIVTLKNDEGEYPLPYAEMANAKLVLSDALVQQFLKAREKKAAEESAAITESSMIDVN